MPEDTEVRDGDEQPPNEPPRTRGHVERTILHHMAGEDASGAATTTVGGVLDDIAAVIRRGDYANVGPPTAASGTVRQSSIRRTFGQLREKGLVRRVEELDPDELRDGRYDLGSLESSGDPEDPSSYARTSDDARVTDWVLTDAGRREVEHLDARYAAELDELAARYGRPPGETTERIDA